MRTSLRNGAIYLACALLFYFLIVDCAAAVADYLSPGVGGAIGHFGALAFHIVHLPGLAAGALLDYILGLDPHDYPQLLVVIGAATNALIVFGLTHIHTRWN